MPTQSLTDHRIPFKWGIKETYIDYEKVNSALLLITGRYFKAIPDEPVEEEKFGLYYLYIRNTGTNPSDPLTTQYRIITMSEEVEADVDTHTTTNAHSAVARAINNSVNEHRLESGVIAAIIRCDPPALGAVAVIRLIAWRVRELDTKITMDVLKVPESVEITLGDEQDIGSDYSGCPRTIFAETIHNLTLLDEQDASLTPGEGRGHHPRTWSLPRAKWLDDINDQTRIWAESDEYNRPYSW